jgi:predicted nucleic acid-binding protein
MRFVLDASITITWALRDEDHPSADLAFERLGSGSAIVPAIWWYEVRNVLVLNERRGRISPGDSVQFLLDLQMLSITIDLQFGGPEIVDLSRMYKLSVYDAAYLALAVRERIPLSTLDGNLGAAAMAAGVPLLA